MKNILAQNMIRTFGFQGVVEIGIIENTFRVRCSNGIVLTLPREHFSWLKLGDMPSLTLGIVVTQLVDGGEVPEIKTN